VVIARAKHPIPSRTRPLSAVAPMVLRLKTRESRSPPNLKRNTTSPDDHSINAPKTPRRGLGAGWSSPVARQAHNLKVTGSNPVPATKLSKYIKDLETDLNSRVLACRKHLNATSTFDEPLNSTRSAEWLPKGCCNPFYQNTIPLA